VQLIVGWPPGGAADLLARLIGQPLSERLGQPFIIAYRPGVGSNSATEAVVRAPHAAPRIRAVNGTSADARR
jgi:tripartite-type tricarboxylate transporter receptor subunit TctC